MQTEQSNHPASGTSVATERSVKWQDRLAASLQIARRDQLATIQNKEAVKPARKRNPLSAFKKIEHFFSALFRIGRTRRETRDNRQKIEELERRLCMVEGRADDFDEQIRALKDTGFRFDRIQDEQSGKILRLRQDNALFSRAYTDLTRRVDASFYRLLPKLQDGGVESILRAAHPATRLDKADGLEALLASFYNTLQDRYRGSREEIKRRMVKYLSDVRAVTERTGKPVLDLGAGRGEWLELLAENKIEGIGVDSNPIQISEASAANITIHQDDACAYLARCADGSFSVISAHHLVEHLPFETLTWLIRETLRVLAPGGLLLLETPNPRNILVGATTFYADPTHIKPLPPEVLETLLETLGYHPVEVRFIHPHERLDFFLHEKRIDPELAYLLFGPQDTAILGHKPDLSLSELTN